MDSLDSTALLECPLCDFTVLPSDDYVLQLHFEQVHTTDSPFRINDDAEPLPPPLPPRPSKTETSGSTDLDEREDTVLCTEGDCGELVPLTEFNDHLDYHAAETLSFDETTGKYHSKESANMLRAAKPTHHIGRPKPSSLEQNFNTELPEALRRPDDAMHRLKKPQRGRSDTTSSEKSTLSRSIQTFNPFAWADRKIKPPSNSCRLGRAELGPHAWEDRMPRWLHDQLAAGPKITVVNRIGRDGRLIKHEHVQNETPGIIPILAQLSALDRSVKEAYYCHPSTLHIGKTPKEGGFCGYRNIQMLVSYIQGAKAQGHEEFPGRTPGILKLQDLIERAWDKGLNDIGRQQTGGIRDTRKYIGTPEAQALFLSSEIDCGVQAFGDAPDGSAEAHEGLLAAVERYFAQAAVNDGSNVYKTLLPPIYLQQPGHSLTIVGFERRRDGICNLIVFDPMYNTSPAMHKLIGRKDIKTARPEVLYAYRRTAKQLRKHAAFEILMLTAHPPLFPAWDVLRQFPDLRYLYVFFRSRTLGFDVYPEDHFLRNFPWQQYGGLWIVDDARFARSGTISPVVAQTLHRITGEGASNGLCQNGNVTTTFDSCSPFNIGPPAPHSPIDMRKTRYSSLVSSMDGLAAGFNYSIPQPSKPDMAPILAMIGMHPVLPSLATASRQFQQTKLSMLTDVGRRYPGYPTPLSPTIDAKQVFPSPMSEIGSGFVTPRPISPAVCSTSAMSIDGSEMCGPSQRCISHGYDYYAATMGLCSPPTKDTEQVKGKLAWEGMAFVPEAKISGLDALSPPLSPVSGPFQSLTSPMSPRAAMLKNLVDKQALRSLSHQPCLSNSISPPSLSCSYLSTTPDSAPPSTPSPPTIPIANGFESNLASPLTSNGTVLWYTSSRGVDSGLLGVKPLSEGQVAEYRFWRPCGRRACAFGCGGGKEGEFRAARKLFRSAEEVKEDQSDEPDELGAAVEEGESSSEMYEVVVD